MPIEIISTKNIEPLTNRCLCIDHTDLLFIDHSILLAKNNIYRLGMMDKIRDIEYAAFHIDNIKKSKRCNIIINNFNWIYKDDIHTLVTYILSDDRNYIIVGSTDWDDCPTDNISMLLDIVAINQQIQQVKNKILEMGLSDVPKTIIDGELEHLKNLEIIKKDLLESDIRLS